jgi:hypothetical protein
MLSSFEIEFGRFTFSLSCQDKRIETFLKNHYTISLFTVTPDLTITIDHLPSDETSSITSGTSYRYTFLRNQFNFGPDLIRGSWIPEEKTYRLSVAETLFRPEEIWLFDRFLCRIFYTLSLERKISQGYEIITHGTGVVKEGKGYLFFGPPESGKSTVAHLSRRFQVLHDDMVLITVTGDGISMEGVPFNPKVVERENGRCMLSRMFSLHKSDQVRIEKGSLEECTRSILPEIFLPQSLFSEHRNEAFAYLLSCATRLAEHIPYYRLYFTKDERFWNLIEEMEDCHGRN